MCQITMLILFFLVIPKRQTCNYPSLIDATSDQLQVGLEQECFSSVDLVNVSIRYLPVYMPWPTSCGLRYLIPGWVTYAGVLMLECRHISGESTM